MRIDLDVFYEILIIDGKISEESIKYTLNENRFRNKLLKAIISFSEENLNQKSFLKNMKLKNKQKIINSINNENSNKTQYNKDRDGDKERDIDKNKKNLKSYFFIFEENSNQTIEYDYLIIKMEPKGNSNENLLQDIARKLNDLQNDYKLSCVFSDDKVIYLILQSSIEKDESEIYLNSIDYSIFQ
jgi:hypothetical protein